MHPFQSEIDTKFVKIMLVGPQMTFPRGPHVWIGLKKNNQLFLL